LLSDIAIAIDAHGGFVDYRYETDLVLFRKR
jgi:hypothetical protein